jgi:hypothetical protein
VDVRPPTSPQVRRVIVRLREDGRTYDEIAELVGVGPATVNRILRRYRETRSLEPLSPKPKLMTHPGSVTGPTFLRFVRARLVPWLRPGDVVVVHGSLAAATRPTCREPGDVLERGVAPSKRGTGLPIVHRSAMTAYSPAST